MTSGTSNDRPLTVLFVIQQPASSAAVDRPSSQASTADELVDRLSALPVELIREIFTLARGDGRRAGRAFASPLSRQLAPLWYEQVYRDVYLGRAIDYERFLRALHEKPDVAKLVRSLRLSKPSPPMPTPPDFDYAQYQADFTEQACAILLALPALRQLRVYRCAPLAEAVLTATAGNHLNLEEITFQAPFWRRKHPFDLSSYQRLDLYPRLVSLTLLQLSDDPGVPPPELSSLTPPVIFTRLTSLYMDFRGQQQDKLGLILSACSALQSLSLLDESSNPQGDLLSSLQHLPHPSGIVELALASNFPCAPSRVPLILAPFSNLLHIYFCGKTFHLLDDTFTCLSALPLRSVHLGSDTKPSPSSATSSLELEHVDAHMVDLGDPDPDGLYRNFAGEVILPEGDFDLPLWEDGWSSEVVREMQQAADRAGVKTAGSTFYVPKPSSACPVEDLSLATLSLAEDKVDRLSALPPEILQKIFYRVYASGEGPKGPINRHLASWHYQFSYSHVAFHCYGCLHRFMRLIEENAHLAPLVKTIVVSGEVNEDEDEDRQGPVRRPPSPPSVKALTKFFRRTKNLTTLRIYNADPVALLVLKPAFAAKALANLSELVIASPVTDLNHPFHPSHYSALPLYPSLRDFTLSIGRPVDTLVPTSDPPAPFLAHHFARLVELDLGSIRLDGTSVEAILAACAQLVSLTLSDGSGAVDLFQATSRLPAPSLLKNLTLLSFHRSGEDEPLQDVSYKDDIEDVWFDKETEEPVVPPGWALPSWKDGWKPSVVEEVRRAAEEAGVNVARSTFEAEQIEEDYEKEICHLDNFVEWMAEQEAIAWEAHMMAADEEDEADSEWEDVE
ncbi:hypothetical protein JCM10213v2_002951 [Rhodosporidiobolus nylandii]